MVKKLDMIAMADPLKAQTRTAREHNQRANRLFLKDDAVVLKTSGSENNLHNLKSEFSRSKVSNLLP